MDLRHLSFSDGSFDVAICSHVLEHIQEDRQAMAELYRVLRGQSDHVRFYGRDLIDRLESVGFEVQLERFAETLPAEAVTRYALNHDPIFRCTRPLSPGVAA